MGCPGPWWGVALSCFPGPTHSMPAAPKFMTATAVRGYCLASPRCRVTPRETPCFRLNEVMLPSADHISSLTLSNAAVYTWGGPVSHRVLGFERKNASRGA